MRHTECGIRNAPPSARGGRLGGGSVLALRAARFARDALDVPFPRLRGQGLGMGASFSTASRAVRARCPLIMPRFHIHHGLVVDRANIRSPSAKDILGLNGVESDCRTL